MKQLVIYGLIAPDMMDSDYVQSWLRDNGIKQGDEFSVVLNSPGGSAFEGIAMYNLLKPYKPKMIVNGLAASAASIIALAGDTIHLTKGSQVMIHNPWTIAFGDSDDMKSVAEELSQMEKSAVQIYMSHCSLSEEEVRAKMRTTSFFLADDLREMGFKVEEMDGVEVEKPLIAACMNKMNKRTEVINKPNREPEMDTKDTKDLSAQLSAVQTQLNKVTQERDESREAYTALMTQKNDLAKELEVLNQSKLEMEVDAAIDTALERGSLLPKLKDSEKKTLMTLHKYDKDLYQERITNLKEGEAVYAGITDEVAGSGEGAAAKGGAINMKDFDPHSEAAVLMLNEKAVELQKEKPELSFEQAIAIVMGGDDE